MPAPQNEFRQAEQQIKRLPPSAFPEMPITIIKQLEARGCLIPQAAGIPEPHNVIRGQFARNGQMDWAVLCSRNGKSSILVFWGKPCRCPSQLVLKEDRSFLQGIGEGRIGYSRSISAANAATILKYYHYFKESGAPQPPPLDHEGIEDIFVGKASEIHYCYRGQWLRLQGAD